ncbi:hypothetical protein FB451DRAFT_1187919 [Mycena latifolia]|nr:hypothetical protein FB451DRAFT_1187919 [Mycena latifolia]
MRADSDGSRIRSATGLGKLSALFRAIMPSNGPCSQGLDPTFVSSIHSQLDTHSLRFAPEYGSRSLVKYAQVTGEDLVMYQGGGLSSFDLEIKVFGVVSGRRAVVDLF